MDVFVEPRVRRVVADVLGIEASSLASDVSLRDDLALDSLDLVELTAVLEDELKLSLPRAVPSWVRTYGDVVELVALFAPLRAPTARVVLVPPPERQASRVTRCETLTPYAVEIVIDEAQRLGRGTRLDVAVDAHDDLALAHVASLFARLGAHGIDVRVHRADPPGARPHPHAA